MMMMTVRKKQRVNRRRKSNKELNKRIRLKRMKTRIIIVLIRRKGQKELVRKVLHQKESVKHQMKMIMAMMMTPQLRPHLSNRNFRWKIS